ncbi:aminoglycoside phosphotransferase [Streptomyces subrutilus]|uniref:Aminoglycoside phosphotransferase n=1 Tax=Streptomyces subrutilus TaxID=36818 RepID=A0A918RCN6_9ACTN|nr:aminoglycoside phosphotransferase family protein [Streptomyces subrutilus]GGZ95035.1 aminoglycoside phosphotransferase [Streptomyces subrutilus]
MTTQDPAPSPAVLAEACHTAGIDPTGAEPIRIAENETWRLPTGVIARIARPGQLDAATRELRVARWLLDHNIPTVRPLCLPQPAQAAGRPVTFWEELPPHEHGSTTEVARTLKALHALPLPAFDVGRLDPFVRIPQRLAAATTLDERDRHWLLALQADLSQRWTRGLPAGLPPAVVHGDAWPGNIVRTAQGTVLMDLERCAVGPREWDLTSTAVRARTTGAVSPADYEQFCEAYGHDVTQWDGYEVLAGARELRMVTYAAQHAATHPAWQQQAQYRVDCLRGRHGPRPWQWRGIM